MKTLQDLSERIQEDLDCLLDGFDRNLVTVACQIIVDKVNEYKIQVNEWQRGYDEGFIDGKNWGSRMED